VRTLEKSTERWIEKSRPFFDVVPDAVVENENFPKVDKSVDYDLREELRDDNADSKGVQASHSRNKQRDIKDSSSEHFENIAQIADSFNKALAVAQCNNDKLLGRLTSNNLPIFSGDLLDWL
jgi:hypothetical protein